MEESSEIDTTTFTPTDLSTTLSVTLESQSNGSKYPLDITRDDLEKCQQLHTVQLLKLELSQKQLVIDAIRNEHASQVEDLREQLAEALHEKKLVSLRLQSLSHGYEQELKRAREKLQGERTGVARAGSTTPKKNTTELMFARMKEEVEVVVAAGPLMNEVEYKHLKSTDSALLPVGDYVRLKFYELTKPLQKQCDDLQRKVSQLNQQVAIKEEKLITSEEGAAEFREKVTSLEGECLTLTQELSLVKTHVLEGNYKANNFDSVKRERDGLRKEVAELQSTVAETETRDKLVREELERLTKELSSVQQSESLLRHDKDYLSRQNNELAQKITSTEEKLEGLTEEHVLTKRAKEKLYEQFIKSKEESHTEYDHKLEVELEGLRSRTALEMEQLRAQTREMYGRESKVLQDAKDAAFNERDQAKAAEKEATHKYESLLKEHHALQGSTDKHLVELQGELQVVRFEKERNALVQRETLKDTRHLQLEQEKYLKKVELLTQELWTTKCESEGKIRGLETELQEARQKLENYEKVEKELDEIVMQSAELEHSCDAERVLFSYGFGTSVPTHSKRRLQQSVHLAKRVLQLEKMNSSLQSQIKKEQEKVCQLQEELDSSKELLKGSQQPYGYLVGRVKDLMRQLKESRLGVATLEKEMAAMASEKAALVETKNQMASDLERLLNHREELHLMKTILLGRNEFSSLPYHPPPPPHHRPPPPGPHHSPPLHWECNHQAPSSQAQKSDSSHNPHPTVFTKQSHSKVLA